MLAGRILDALRMPMQIGGQTVAVTGSVGIATYPAGGLTAEEVVSHADGAMYRAKRRGKDQFDIYAPKAETGAGAPVVAAAEGRDA